MLMYAYGGVGALTLVAYYPTVSDLHHHKKPSANVPTYFLWTIASTIAFLYGIFVLRDTLFLVASGVNFFANILVLALRLRLPH